jgi:hypothetical protein
VLRSCVLAWQDWGDLTALRHVAMRGLIGGCLRQKLSSVNGLGRELSCVTPLATKVVPCWELLNVGYLSCMTPLLFKQSHYGGLRF